MEEQERPDSKFEVIALQSTEREPAALERVPHPLQHSSGGMSNPTRAVCFH